MEDYRSMSAMMPIAAPSATVAKPVAGPLEVRAPALVDPPRKEARHQSFCQMTVKGRIST